MTSPLKALASGTHWTHRLPLPPSLVRPSPMERPSGPTLSSSSSSLSVPTLPTSRLFVTFTSPLPSVCVTFIFPHVHVISDDFSTQCNEPPIPTPPHSSSSSLRTLSNASGSSTTLLGPPMTRDDARIIFSNLPELAEFADDFVSRLEAALGSVLPSGDGEDRVGALFIAMVRRRPSMLLFWRLNLSRSLVWNRLPSIISPITRPP